MDIHKLLKRQLERAHLKAEQRPESDEQWMDFISRISQTYVESDQERYMNERSMEIFSREMMDLNAMLEKAQRIASLGYWSYDGSIDKIVWSKELYALFKNVSSNMPTSYPEFMKLVHEQDREELKQKVDTALSDKIDYECDFRLLTLDGDYRWFQTIGQCKDGDQQLTGIIVDIHKKKATEEEIKELNNRIVSTARRAGMVEVATSILHNIGNILNSSNVSISMLKKGMSQSYQQKLAKIAEMLDQHKDNLADFLTNDPKGQVIPKYLTTLSGMIGDEQDKNTHEIDNLTNDLNHIKEIVSMQESISGVSSIKEKIFIPELLDTAINMSLISSKDKEIEVIKEFDNSPLLNTDKSKLLQIFVNLIQNARDATLSNSDNPFKEIKLIIKKTDENIIQVRIEDNGLGIDPEHLERIFAFGFTTKEHGHGFGLHSSALCAQEMGGSLRAESLGKGHGAQFILTLPIKNISGAKGVFNE